SNLLKELIGELDGLLVIFEKEEVFVDIVLVAFISGDVERTGGDGESHLLPLASSFEEEGEEPVARKLLFDEKVSEFVPRLICDRLEATFEVESLDSDMSLYSLFRQSGLMNEKSLNSS
ncbi:hypothetical protein BpHYR1_031978, partial [Brachionus plicatilis]